MNEYFKKNGKFDKEFLISLNLPFMEECILITDHNMIEIMLIFIQLF